MKISVIQMQNYKDNKLNLIIVGGSQFHINSLENDIGIVKQKFSDFFNQKMDVCFKIKKDSKKKDSGSKPEQHPLLPKALDLLNGEIILEKK